MKSRSHRLPTISDTPDDWVDESWTVDCVCGVNFDDGEEMVDCDECGVWVHTRCARYVKSEKLFACDKCKSKKLRKETEESEVAQLLVELPTKTLRMDKPYSVGFASHNHFQVCSDIPLEDKVHVQGVPGGDPGLFRGMSSVFSQTLWKCTGHVPKKFNHQYREFPCWDERKDDDNDDDKVKEETESRANNGADALFSLSKENGSVKTVVNGGGALDMGLPSSERKKQEVENNEGRQQQSVVRKERSLMKPIVIYGNRKKNDSRMSKDQNKKKNVKVNEIDGDSKRKDLHSTESVSIDAKQSESNEGKGPMVFNTDKQRDVQANPKPDDCLEDNNKPLENVPLDHSRPNPSEEAKQIEEKGDQVPPSGEISSQTKDGMASPLKHNPMETSTMKHPAARDDVNNRRIYSRSNGIRSNTNNLGKVTSPPKGELHVPVEVKAVEISHTGKSSISQKIPTSDLKLDSSKKENDPVSTSSELKKEAVSVSEKEQNVEKNQPHVDSKVDEPDESPCGPRQPKGQTKGSESSTLGSFELKHGSGTLEGQSKSHGTVTSPPSGAPNQRKVSAVKSSVGKSSSKPSVHDRSRYSNTEDRNSSGKQKGVSDNNNYSKSKKDHVSTESLKNRENISEKPKKLVRDIPKSSSTSVLKSSHLSKSSHAPVSKKSSSELKAPANLSSSGDSANSSRSESSGAYERNKSTSEVSVRGEKTSQSNRHPAAPRNHPPQVHPPGSSNTPATNLSDEELALLLHQELNSSPRVPRVPRMRHAGSLPQLASTTTSTSTLLKRTSTSGAKDNNGLVGSRKKNKELANNVPSSSREFDGPKKVPSVPNSRMHHDLVKNGSAKAAHPPASTTVSSGPSSSNEANEQNHNASDDETGPVTHRTLPALLADIMSKGKRMTYEELCNEVLPHWPNLRKHNGERYAYSSHSQAVLDCLRNRSEWSRLVDRGPKTNGGGRKRRKSEADLADPESEDDDYSTDRNTKELDSNEFPKGKRKARKHRRLALQGRGIKDVRRRRKAEISDDTESSSDSSEESEFSDEEMQEGGPNEASASSDEMGTMS